MPEDRPRAAAVRVFYSPDYVGAGFAFGTTRKAQWIAESLDASPIPGIELVEPAPLERWQIEEVHDPAYVEAVETGEPRSLAESQGFEWDQELWTMVCASNGGAVAAALAAMEDGVAGSLSSGLHHAKYDRGEGFCTFNGLALAAKAALAEGAGSVLILDLDAHCGGGTASLIEGEPRILQLDVAVNDFDAYSASDQAVLTIVRKSSEYLSAVRHALEEAGQYGADFGLCLYNAGMDPYERSSPGGLVGITQEILAERERIVFEWCRARKVPIAFVLAGGYSGPGLDASELVELHRLTLMAAGRR
jgi:acetoin utilization deacetylase AcuC-like enzyme